MYLPNNFLQHIVSTIVLKIWFLKPSRDDWKQVQSPQTDKLKHHRVPVTGKQGTKPPPFCCSSGLRSNVANWYPGTSVTLQFCRDYSLEGTVLCPRQNSKGLPRHCKNSRGLIAQLQKPVTWKKRSESGASLEILLGFVACYCVFPLTHPGPGHFGDWRFDPLKE